MDIVLALYHGKKRRALAERCSSRQHYSLELAGPTEPIHPLPFLEQKVRQLWNYEISEQLTSP
ncbi:MAG TPA: hypothetical protein VEI28_01095 [Thermodesulfovibrionales bacterium]|nr:hypothetical protein [Thermodesulfovibrionales bacterium]